MDRRQLLMLASTMPLLASQPAPACSFALASPLSTARQHKAVLDLFSRWWQRDRDAFNRSLTDIFRNDGTLIDPNAAAGLFRLLPTSPDTLAMFDRFFNNEKRIKHMAWMLNSPAAMVVGCTESEPNSEIGADCSGTPLLHVFMIDMFGLNPRAVTHLATTTTPQPATFNLWAGD